MRKGEKEWEGCGDQPSLIEHVFKRKKRRMRNVIITRYSTEPPSKPITLQGEIYDEWLNVETGERWRWEGSKWALVIAQEKASPAPCLEDGKTFSMYSIEAEEGSPYP